MLAQAKSFAKPAKFTSIGRCSASETTSVPQTVIAASVERPTSTPMRRPPRATRHDAASVMQDPSNSRLAPIRRPRSMSDRRIATAATKQAASPSIRRFIAGQFRRRPSSNVMAATCVASTSGASNRSHHRNPNGSDVNASTTRVPISSSTIDATK